MKTDYQRENAEAPHWYRHGKRRLRDPPELLFLEGRHDFELLRRLSRVLWRQHVISSDLDSLVYAGRLIVVPMGGIHADWENRFAILGCPQFFLLDRELEPETAHRRLLVDRINSRPGSQACLMSKRNLECYLHPAAISAAGGENIEFGDGDSVAEALARTRFSTGRSIPWNGLSRRTRQRLANQAKGWLCTAAADHMTAEWLAERDPNGEVIEWLRTIIALTPHVETDPVANASYETGQPQEESGASQSHGHLVQDRSGS